MTPLQTFLPLIPAADFERSGRCPVNLRWLIFHQKESLQDAGAIIRFGKRRWLVDESNSSTGSEKKASHSVLSAEKN